MDAQRLLFPLNLKYMRTSGDAFSSPFSYSSNALNSSLKVVYNFLRWHSVVGLIMSTEFMMLVQDLCVLLGLLEGFLLLFWSKNIQSKSTESSRISI
eukprot:TRINITY_DN5505_c0_g1_i1.p1 TRINITY_DN5505_c0_g1~~TRINITY_DN5505_c0_g1_i1.p1  ORF type:complete len:111 (-),score=8.41 TRINITY_DN5505_c0_g1_i1:358-648(-)